MLGQDKTTRPMLILGAGFVGLFVIFIISVNRWVNRSLEDTQKQIIATVSETKTQPVPANRSLVLKQEQNIGASTISATGEKKVVKEAPILDKYLNE